MTKNEFEEAKELWKLIQAEVSVRNAIAAADCVIRQGIDDKDQLYHALIASVYTLYGRPFTRGDGVGKLSADFIPAISKGIHEEMMLLRDKMFAHNDALTLTSKQFGPVSQAWFTFKGGGEPIVVAPALVLPSEKLVLTIKYMIGIKDLIHYMMVVKLKAFALHRPKVNGEYLLNVYDETKPVFITHAEAAALLPASAKSITVIPHPNEA